MSSSGHDADPDSDPIVKNSTIHNADVTIHAHIFQRPVDVQKGDLDIQILAETVTLNGVEFHHPDRALYLEDVAVTHDPLEGIVDIRAYRST